MSSLENAFRKAALIHDRISKDGIGLNIKNLRVDHEILCKLLQDAMSETPSPHPDQQFGAVTFAQHGDDLMILNLFKLMGIEHPTYLDLGAHDPVIISNTALLYMRGSRGVNVEANPALIEKFQALRPEDTNVNVGVGVLPGTATFYKYSDTSGRNTFSPKEVKSLEGVLEGVLEVQEKIVLPVKSLTEIVNEYCGGDFPDLLSCDIEGLDFDVLCTIEPVGFTRPQPPKLIVVETRRHESEAMRKMLNVRGFELLCRMGENLFFVRNDLMKFVL